MNIKIPWIISRRRKLLAILFDFLISSFLYNYKFYSEFNSYPNKIVTTSFVFFWVLFSYVLGRYIGANKVTFLSISKTIIKTFILLITCNLIYLFINWGYPILFFMESGNFYNLEFRELSNFFIRITIYLSLISTIFQYGFSLVTHNIFEKKKDWFFYGTKEKFDQILKEVSLNKKEIILTWLSNNESLEIIDINKIQGIIVGDFSIISKKNIDIIFKLKLKGIVVESLLSWFEKKFHRIPTNIIDNKYQLLENLKSNDDNFNIRIKRIGDLLVSFILLISTLPISLIIMILIFIEDKGPVFYQQTRTGINGSEIKILKFRSMAKDAEKDGIQWSQKFDPRITKIGRFIRLLRLDELPQLICVIKGDMSLIGPRPERPEIEKKKLQTIPYYNYRNILRPGISGWAQVNYPYGASINDSVKKLSYDIYYISHYSLLLDMLILFKTIKIVLNGKNSLPKN